VGVDFHLLANGAASNIVLDEYSHLWPPVVSADQFECFQVSRVSSRKRIVVTSGDVSSEISISWYETSVFKEE